MFILNLSLQLLKTYAVLSGISGRLKQQASTFLPSKKQQSTTT